MWSVIVYSVFQYCMWGSWLICDGLVSPWWINEWWTMSCPGAFHTSEHLIKCIILFSVQCLSCGEGQNSTTSQVLYILRASPTCDIWIPHPQSRVFNVYSGREGGGVCKTKTGCHFRRGEVCNSKTGCRFKGGGDASLENRLSFFTKRGKAKRNGCNCRGRGKQESGFSTICHM